MTAPVWFRDVEYRPRHAAVAARWSFQVQDGSFTAAAASASTADAVVRLCIGSLLPTRGEVRVLDTEPGSLPWAPTLRFRRRLGVCFRREGLVSTASLRQNLLLPMLFGRGMASREAGKRADEAIRDLGLEPWAELRPQDAPQEARIVAALARAACPRPELQILETPARGVPSQRIREVLDWCRERSHTIFVLPPDRTPPITELADHWIPLADTPEPAIHQPSDDPPGTE